MTDQHPAGQLATSIADTLAHPDAVSTHLTSTGWWRQSLAHGAPGITLLHIEMAAVGLTSWRRAHDWIAYMGATAMTAGADSHLFYGAPALAHVLACATAHRSHSYGRALDVLDREIGTHARRRVDDAHTRIDGGSLPTLAEFDVIRGLTGVGAYLLRRDPQGPALRAILEYLVRLTEPITCDGEKLPGWWVTSGPSGRDSTRFSGGHGNSGVAHGIGGPLALLSLAALVGVRVGGQTAAIGRILAWLDRWRVDTGTGHVWPYWVNRAQLRAGQRGTTDRQPPSWCYGTAGLARAQQLAALATGDTGRQRLAEHALIEALSSPTQRAATTDASLCHGYTGLALIALTAAADAAPPSAADLLALIPGLLDAVRPANCDGEKAGAHPLETAGSDPGLLEGTAGIGLALVAAGSSTLPRTGWDTCLLVA